MDTNKPPYRFYRGKDIMDLNQFKSLYNDGKISQEEYDERMKLYSDVIEANVDNERVWRNGELDKTDKLMLPDSTYGGELVSGTYMHTDIMNYRKQLREYDLRYQDRPTKPSWFK